MKTILPPSRRYRPGFTLVELLTVIAIIGILAALLLPVLAAVKKHAQMTKAHLEASDLATAIEAYDSKYGRFPVSQSAQTAAGTNDYTCGGILTTLTGSWPSPVPANYSPSNSDVVAILMDMTAFPTGTATLNANHVKNPQQTKFLNAHMSGSSPGTGQEDAGVDVNGVYRDPWGNPYIITMDLNYDDMCKDPFYSLDKVSHGNLNGLVDPTDSSGADNNWEFRGKVMVWSAGPDGLIDPTVPANLGVNKDNVLSWQ